jgi:hypothetical protein
MDAVLILEDNETVITGFKQQFDDFGLEVETLYSRTYGEYLAYMDDPAIGDRVKCIVMDLSNNQTEDEALDFKSVQYIKEQYLKNRIPIFIHSGYLSHYNDLDDQGTVYKIEKSPASVKKIVEKIKLLHESGFLDIFCKKGRLETNVVNQIHDAFISQFKGDEIEEIIKSIRSANGQNLRNRTTEVFERIALRAVYQNAISNILNDEPVKVNSIEHYYRRTNREAMPFWTGDIFEIPANDENPSELVVIVTPRCNAANCNYEQILICKILSLNGEELQKIRSTKKDSQDGTVGQKNLQKNITDDATGERRRFLPKTPQFEGGIVDFVKCFSVSVEQFQSFFYRISLVDDLANDVVRKLANYLLRGGIADTAYSEAYYYFSGIEAGFDDESAKSG